MRKLLAAVTTLALTTALALAAPLAASADTAHADPIMTHQMIGSLDYVNFVPGEGLIAVGWAVNTLSPATPVYMSIKGQYPDGHSGDLGQGNAAFDRPDVAAAVPGAGAAHGFRISLGGYPPAGLYSICAYAWSEAVGCSFVTMPAETVTGQLESVTLGTGYSGGTALILRGWTSDSYQANGEARTNISYVVGTSNGAVAGSGSSRSDRPDVRAAHPSLTGVAGFQEPFDISGPGDHRVCATAADLRGNPSAILGCLDVTVPAFLGGPPTVSGQATVGGTVTATAPTWSPTPESDQFAWNRYDPDAGFVAVTSSRTYSPGLADVGHYLTFTENVSKQGVFPTNIRIDAGPVTIPGVTTSRIGGADRYEMAVANSQAQFPDATAGAPVVYVASGEKFPDALAAGPAAAKEHGALLLTFADHLPDSVRAEITRLHPASIVVAGGPATVSDAVLADLATLAPASRIDGADRYAVSRNLIAHAFPQGAPSVYLVTGANYADALSAGAAAASVGAPVLLTDGGAGAADDATRAALTAAGTTAVTVVGGTASVSPGVAGSLGTGIAVNRLSGPDRYTGTVVLNRASFSSAGTVYLATGLNFPDGLTGGVHAGADHASLYLVNGTCVPQDVLADIVSLHASKVVLLGGPASLNQDVQNLYACS